MTENDLQKYKSLAINIKVDSPSGHFYISNDVRTGGLGPGGIDHQPSAVSGATGVRKNFLFGMATQMGGGFIQS